MIGNVIDLIQQDKVNNMSEETQIQSLDENKEKEKEMERLFKEINSTFEKNIENNMDFIRDVENDAVFCLIKGILDRLEELEKKIG